jgi:mannose-6-phosphate isomerase-like protein (cupin superfamily)
MSDIFEQAQDFDLIHNYFGVLPVMYSGLVTRPILTTIRGIPSDGLLPVYRKYNEKAYYVSVSDAERSPDLSYLATIYPGIDIESFTFRGDPGTYLLVIAGGHAEEGIREAVEIADVSQVDLRIAGSLENERYFEEHIKPQVHGDRVRRLGSIGPDRKNELMGNALAVLNLGRSFDFSAAEANACGTPVIASLSGAAGEIIRHGFNGFLVTDVAEAVEAVRNVRSISRSDCRKVAEQRFSAGRMVDDYMKIYERVLAETSTEDRRPWGYYEILCDSPDHKVKRIVVRPGKRLSLQRHKHRSEHWTVVKGEPLVTVDGKEMRLAPGDSIGIPLGAQHRIANPGEIDVVFIEVQTGHSFAEQDIERFEDDFGRVRESHH